MNFRNMISHLSSLGHPITDVDLPSLTYNEKKACIKWCHNMTTKENHHIENNENAVKEWVEEGSV
jgi:hypothetical protein